MNQAKRISYIFTGLLTAICSLILFIWNDEGFGFILLILEFSLLLHGIQKLLFYFKMARHMVGGIRIFYEGLLYLDAGLFTLTLNDVPKIFGILYLITVMFISGIIAVLKANEIRRQKSSIWKYSMFSGVVKTLIAFSCLFHLDSFSNITMLYSIGLFYSSISHIVTAFRKTAIVYIQ